MKNHTILDDNEQVKRMENLAQEIGLIVPTSKPDNSTKPQQNELERQIQRIK